ncbi:helix-turn-helix domain-containing protein [Alistipes finegoldii]|uniref:helix-turn-helix domain-containing protein n=1 Tax=Alistipes finegoldii TaxID=214856 RepID=UPI00189A7802|nr:helix-turn-helix domain-containing protein [Alistipes finegoldii]
MERLICIEENVLRALLAQVEALAIAARNLQQKVKPKPDEGWIEGEDVCRILTLSKRTLQTYREKGIIPYTCIGGKIFYRRNDIAIFLDSKTVKK